VKNPGGDADVVYIDDAPIKCPSKNTGDNPQKNPGGNTDVIYIDDAPPIKCPSKNNGDNPPKNSGGDAGVVYIDDAPIKCPSKNNGDDPGTKDSDVIYIDDAPPLKCPSKNNGDNQPKRPDNDLPPCKDINPRCSKFKKNCKIKKVAAVILTNCPETCGLCKAPCRDVSKHCKHWVSSFEKR
jgi:hypothetical protein